VFTRDPATGAWTHKTELTDPSAANGDEFGHAVTICGDTAIVGARGDAGAGSGRGAAHVFTRDPATGAWTHETELTDPSAANGDQFGAFVGISGDTGVVGANFDSELRGAAHIFERAPRPYQKLVDPSDHLRGSSVAISGDTMVVGDELDDGAGSNRGAARVFTRDPATGIWGSLTELVDPNAADGDEFGWSAAISGDTLVVGAHKDDGAGANRGAAHVFTRDPATGTWSHLTELVDPYAADYDYFGESVAISGGTVVVGAYCDDGAGNTRGAAHVFARDPATGTWTHTAELTDPNAADWDYFGESVSISGDTIVVGAIWDDGAGDDWGAAHVFTRNPATGTWAHKVELSDPNAGTYDEFGESVAISHDTIVIGVRYDDGTSTDLQADFGAAHVFTRDPGTGAWQHKAELTDPNAAEDDWLGLSVAVSGSTILVGAQGDDAAGTNRGAAHAFTFDPATGLVAHRGEARDPTAANHDGLGYPVAASLDTLVMAAIPDNGGSVHMFPLLGTCNGRVATHLAAHTGSILTGDTGNDVLVGGPGADTLSGGNGDDLVCGNGGADTLNGEGGADTLYGHAGDDTIDGGAGNDIGGGSSGDDTIDGGAGDDKLYGGPGVDIVHGNDGHDRIFGSTGDDTLIGDSGRDTIYGGDGNDQIGGGYWGDTLFGEAGHDRIYCSGGADTAHGGDGNDRIYASHGNDTVTGGDGDDRIWGGAHDDDLSGDAGRDKLYGEGGDDVLKGGGWPDLLVGHGGKDKLYGGGGDDSNYGGTGWDVCTNETIANGCERIL
jgi:Ca2+-binding RTX toxin-like protein